MESLEVLGEVYKIGRLFYIELCLVYLAEAFGSFPGKYL